MVLISPGEENLLDFLELRQVLSTYDGDLRGPHWFPQERPVPMRVAQGPLGIPLPSMPGPKPCVESVPEPEDSSPALGSVNVTDVMTLIQYVLDHMGQ